LFWYRQFPEDFFAFGIFLAVLATAGLSLTAVGLARFPRTHPFLDRALNSRWLWYPLGLLWAVAIIPPVLPAVAGLAIWLLMLGVIVGLMWAGIYLWRFVVWLAHRP
jgi:hypothetical protein